MTRTVATCIAIGLLAGRPADGQDMFKSAHHDFRVVTVADGLVNPWSMAWLPGGDMLITERPGRLRIVRQGALLPDPVDGVPEVFAQGQGGLFDVLPHTDFASNRLLYLSYARPLGTGSTTAVVRGRFENDRFTNVEEIFEANTSGRGHYGGRLAWDHDGLLFLTVGERQVPSTGDLEAHPAQDLSNHHGVTVRLLEDGGVPPDNPFVGQAGALPEIWSYGHRNPQGLAVHPENGDVWLDEHGRRGGRAQPRATRPQLWLARHWIRRELPERVRHPRRHPRRGHRSTDAFLDPLDRHLRTDDLHGRPFPVLEGQLFHRRHGRPAARPTDTERGSTATD